MALERKEDMASTYYEAGRQQERWDAEKRRTQVGWWADDGGSGTFVELDDPDADEDWKIPLRAVWVEGEQ